MLTLIILALFAGAILVAIRIYNRLVALRNESQNAFAQIDIQLTRRYELIPNLVEVAKRYLKHEQDTLTAVINARNTAATALKNQEIPALGAAEQRLGQQLGGLFATFENYPDLKADQQLLALQEEIVSSENRVAFARQYFNDCVTEFNNAREIFPNNIIAGICAFSPQTLLEMDDIATKRQPVTVSFE